MQVFEWGGMYWIELRMAFGTISSPFYFDTGSDVQKEITCRNVQVSPRHQTNRSINGIADRSRRGLPPSALTI